MTFRKMMIALGAFAMVSSLAGLACATTVSYNVVELGALPGSVNGRVDVTGWGLNNLGQVAGYGEAYAAALPRPPRTGFLWSQGTYTTFSDPNPSLRRPSTASTIAVRWRGGQANIILSGARAPGLPRYRTKTRAAPTMRLTTVAWWRETTAAARTSPTTRPPKPQTPG